MNKEEAIKYLQQLYPYGSHCWLDEQRIEAVGMAIKALQEEPVSEIDFEQELYKAFGHVKDFALGMQIAKWFYSMGKNSQEPVSEEWIKELRTKLDSLSKEDFKKVFDKYAVGFNEEPVSDNLEEAAHQCYEPNDKFMEGFKKGAKWQKEQMMAKAIDGHVTFEFYGLDSKTYGTIAHDPICLDDFGLKDTDKVKVIVIKDD